MAETITEYIKRDLCFRLSGAGESLDKLTLAALAKHYKVSLMPIRLAVRELIAEGVLLKQANGRLKVNRTAIGVRTSASTRPARSSAERIFFASGPPTSLR